MGRGVSWIVTSRNTGPHGGHTNSLMASQVLEEEVNVTLFQFALFYKHSMGDYKLLIHAAI